MRIQSVRRNQMSEMIPKKELYETMLVSFITEVLGAQIATSERKGSKQKVLKVLPLKCYICSPQLLEPFPIG